MFETTHSDSNHPCCLREVHQGRQGCLHTAHSWHLELPHNCREVFAARLHGSFSWASPRDCRAPELFFYMAILKKVPPAGHAMSTGVSIPAPPLPCLIKGRRQAPRAHFCDRRSLLKSVGLERAAADCSMVDPYRAAADYSMAVVDPASG